MAFARLAYTLQPGGSSKHSSQRPLHDASPSLSPAFLNYIYLFSAILPSAHNAYIRPRVP